MKQTTLAINTPTDSLSLALHAARNAARNDLLRPLDGYAAVQRLNGCKGALVRGVVGNSAWGRSMRAKQIVAARWKKKKSSE